MTWNEPAPNERDAEERSWNVVRAAWEERVPLARKSPVRRWQVAVLAAGLAVAAAALSPPGTAVLGSLRDAVRGERDQLLSLPAPGRLLVQAPAGAWVVQRDGSKRFLSGYAEATWSPHGLYVAAVAVRDNELVALEPNGRIHWKLARAGAIGAPQWSYEGYRIAYLAGHALRVVNGDGTADRLLTSNAVGTGLAALAWRPGTHELAFKNALDEVVLLDVDRNRVLWRRSTNSVERLLWSDDGRRLLVAASPSTVLDAGGRVVATFARTRVLPASFAPHSHDLALVTATRGRSSVSVYTGPHYVRHRTIFSASGVFAGLAWSPDRRWLLVDWSTADEWIFIRSTAVRRVKTIANIDHTFGAGPEAPSVLVGWCCR